MTKRLSRKEIETYKRAWKAREIADDEAQETRRQQALKAAERLAEVLVEKYNAERVYLIGSILSDREYNERSDIDLVVEALKDDLFFRAYSELIFLTPFLVDLIPLEDSFPGIKRLVSQQGMCIYEKSQ